MYKFRNNKPFHCTPAAVFVMEKLTGCRNIVVLLKNFSGVE